MFFYIGILSKHMLRNFVSNYSQAEKKHHLKNFIKMLFTDKNFRIKDFETMLCSDKILVVVLANEQHSSKKRFYSCS